MLNELQESRRSALVYLANVYTHAEVARRADVCQPSVKKWCDGTLTRSSTGKVIENAIVELAAEMQGKLNAIRVLC